MTQSTQRHSSKNISGPRAAARSIALALSVLLISFATWSCESLSPQKTEPLSAADSGGEVYRLRAGDAVLLDVFQEPFLTTHQKIIGDGTISVGLIGRVHIEGDTVVQAGDKIAKLLNEKQLVNPQVTITIESYAPRRFTVWGQVRNPGSYVIPNEEQLSLPEAIGMAGGNTEIGNPKNVTVTRRSDGVRQKIKVNALSPAAENFMVKEGDIIFMNETLL